MRDIAYESEPMTGADDVGAEWREPIVGHSARLEVADVIGRVVHQLEVPNTALMRLFEPFELHFEEVESLDVSDNRWLPDGVRRRQIGRGKRPAQAVVSN
jgi:hypothetical protein